MSNHDYSKYSKKNSETTNTTVDKTSYTMSEETIDIVETADGYETYDVVSNSMPELDMNEVAEVEPEITIVAPNVVPGTVTDCTRLNVRVAPFTNAEVACVLNANSQLEVIPDESVTDWYKVCTATGIEGYCMRRFVSI